MTVTIESFSGDCRAALIEQPGPEGVEKVRQLLEVALQDEDFIQTHLGPDADSPRNILYQDPDLGFCIIAHVYKGSSVGNPHDHADAWAIYGQASGVTRMTEWRKLADPDGDRPGKVEEVRSFDQNPGDASAWQVGEMHSPARDGETRLIRIEGRNMDGVKRDKYERPGA
ncbi:MAG: hypothetical protein QGH73_14770 [Rhodospirillales bacterium]|nr:hypothetical protein [Rhodospirillaceae bacterium]MDP6430441.1 hypothetical protein [Rhodospirillales bacterium]MDP6642897.1 hypothetical protein [Rhodospirillales bacterium]MDP6842933.1 hypothetical protein [Rhodospirillales bacterium]